MAGATLTGAGLTIQTVDQIRAELAATLQASFGVSLQALASDSVIGAIVRAIAELDALEQEAIQAVYVACSLDGAAGVSLDRLVLLGGLQRKPATQSLVNVTIHNPTGAPIAIPQGAVLENTATRDQFAIVDAGVSAPAGGDIVAQVRATAAGPVPVPATMTWAWISSFAGATSTTLANPTVGEAGNAQETDADLRLRFVASFHLPGSGTLSSILAAVLAVRSVDDDAQAFENVELGTGITSPKVIGSLPGKSFVVVQRGGAVADVAAAIWAKKPAGIKSYGTTIQTVVDSQGYSHSVGLVVAANVQLFVKLTLTGSASGYGNAIKAAVVAYVDGLTIGANVIAVSLICAALDVAGQNVSDLVALIDTVDPPVASGNLAIAWNQKATLALADVDLVFL